MKAGGIKVIRFKNAKELDLGMPGNALMQLPLEIRRNTSRQV